MYSLKRLASMWRSDFHLNNVFEDTVATDHLVDIVSRIQSVKCGLWWMCAASQVFIRGCDTNTKRSQIWFVQRLPMLGYMSYVRSVVIDPLQDLAVAVSSNLAEQGRHVFSVTFWSVSSQRPHPDSACTSLECKHPCFMAPDHHIFFVGQPAICGDRIVVLYFTTNIGSLGTRSNIFIQVIDWRKGLAKGYPLYELGWTEADFHLLDEQRIIVIGPDSGRMALYTLQELDGSPRRRIVYVLPKVQRYLRPLFGLSSPCVIHATPSFHGAAARPDLMPDYVTSPEAQIMVLEVLSRSWQVILVIDMAIFSAKAVHSEIPVEIPWLEWGPKYARCFPHHPSHRISVFGRKMAYALPQYRAPEPGQRLEELPTEGSFYVQIWDFSRTIARSECPGNIRDRNSPDRLICKPGRLAQTCFEEDIGNLLAYHPYATAVCPTGFSTRDFHRFFLEHDRLTLTWARPDSVHIQVVSPSQMEVDLDVGQAHSPEPHEAKQTQSRNKTNILFHLLTKLLKRWRDSE
ncbi:hypothetical protein DEU56DRAFT_327105 [Suillus clintonianus]|uniref:uncharacterized protein n=1 Tax=Suillus clintonianus TaxID=1904413 RepID=UPI001B86FE93|nr:uncharacterized protein DEU56DRAFT_327105 [Suillus clintonianus]KAG2139325.1 hypothetical protein DEU56DRAFT_327105 [Suillus clintonianus]